MPLYLVLATRSLPSGFAGILAEGLDPTDAAGKVKDQFELAHCTLSVSGPVTLPIQISGGLIAVRKV